MTYSKFDEKTKPETVSPVGSLEVKRTNTDVPVIGVFICFVILWIGIAIFAFYNGDIETYSNFWFHRDIYYTWHYITLHFYDAKYIIIGFFALSILFLITFITIFRWATKVFIYITIVLIPVFLILMYIFISYVTLLRFINEFTIGLLIIFTITYGMIMYALKKTGIDIVCKIIKESCKAIFFFPSTSLFIVVHFILDLAVMSLAMWTYLYLNTIVEYENIDHTNSTNETMDYDNTNLTSNSTEDYFDDYNQFYHAFELSMIPGYIIFFHIINLLMYFWVHSFILGTGKMVLTATFVTWYFNKDSKLIPKATLGKSFVAITRHHTGTIAYASSPASIIPMFYIIWKHGRDRLKEVYKNPVLMLSWISILMKFASDALNLCAIEGNAFYQSAKESYILLMKHPMSFLAINTATECIIFLGSMLVPVLTLISITLYSVYVSTLKMEHKITAGFTVTIATILMSQTFLMVFRVAADTIRYCYLRDSKFNHESEMNLYEVHVDETLDKDISADAY